MTIQKFLIERSRSTERFSLRSDLYSRRSRATGKGYNEEKKKRISTKPIDKVG